MKKTNVQVNSACISSACGLAGARSNCSSGSRSGVGLKVSALAHQILGDVSAGEEMDVGVSASGAVGVVVGAGMGATIGIPGLLLFPSP